MPQNNESWREVAAFWAVSFKTEKNLNGKQVICSQGFPLHRDFFLELAEGSGNEQWAEADTL